MQTKDGRLINGISYSVNSSALPNDPTMLASTMPGGMTAGVYRIRTASGWVFIPANQIAGVSATGGAPT